MPKIAYEYPDWLAKWLASSGDLDDLPSKSRNKVSKIFLANEILDEYEKQGYQLTLRQLYYQFVARDLIPNKQTEYKALGGTISDGRLWGLIDWDRLVDRGRNFERRSHWDDPADIIQACARGYGIDCWTDSTVRIEVWVEKQALEDVISRPCRRFDCGYIACKGYMSQSEMWAAAQRLIAYENAGQRTIILHLGDHDPSGVDMTRDIQDRLAMFHSSVEVQRIALTMEQIEEHEPPPNPAKLSDSRCHDYIARFGDESWELDALEPAVLDALITEHIEEHLDDGYRQRREQEETDRSSLTDCSDRWDDVVEFLED